MFAGRPGQVKRGKKRLNHKGTKGAKNKQKRHEQGRMGSLFL
jgi:hypothetical protein